MSNPTTGAATKPPKVLNARIVGRTANNAIYVGRPSKWGNPFTMKREADRPAVLAQFEQYVKEHPELVEAAKQELPDKDLICWCAPKACHGDLWLRIANEEPAPVQPSEVSHA